MTPYSIFLIFLYFIVLVFLLPALSGGKIYSLYNYRSDIENRIIEDTKQEFRKVGSIHHLGNLSMEESIYYHEQQLKGTVDHLIVVLAKSPRNEKHHVLTQLATEVDANVRSVSVSKGMSSGMFICNTSQHEFTELDILSRYYPVLTTSNNASSKHFNKEDIKRRDFLGCLGLAREVSVARYMTIIWDVVVPYPGFLRTLGALLSTRINCSIRRGELVPVNKDWLYLSLHEPVASRGFGSNLASFHELIVMALFGMILFYLIFLVLEPGQTSSTRVLYCFYGILYFITLSLIIGRPYLTELRRLSPTLFRVYQQQEPTYVSAITVPTANSRELTGLLQQTRCSSYSPFHHVLDRISNTLEKRILLVSPSLVRYVVQDL
ncbi:GPI-N-acetylgalactosamine transferase PGAP4-like isoform X1 [Oratosquilla oratoria]|uniref:GPI-N-acetylgalactosamine transferase PGAP4-like isoform X1 n=1 Tax=Oratosquilla oratoria TaxID=337810 RepID=UPI003F7603A8